MEALLIMVVSVAVAIGTGLSIAIFERTSGEYRIERLARRNVREAVEGETVRLVGKVRFAGRTLAAPLSGTVCAAYRCEDWGAPMLFSASSKRLLEQESADFLIEDESGIALVRASGAAVVLALPVRPARVADDVIEQLLKRHGYRPPALTTSPPDECVLTEGMTVAVGGIARWEIDPDPVASIAAGGYRDSPRRLTLHAPPGRAIVVSDRLAATA